MYEFATNLLAMRHEIYRRHVIVDIFRKIYFGKLPETTRN